MDNAAILAYEAPQTGKVTITLEIYQNGITKMELGGVVRIKPDGAVEVTGKIKYPQDEEWKHPSSK